MISRIVLGEAWYSFVKVFFSNSVIKFVGHDVVDRWWRREVDLSGVM